MKKIAKLYLLALILEIMTNQCIAIESDSDDLHSRQKTTLTSFITLGMGTVGAVLGRKYAFSIPPGFWHNAIPWFSAFTSGFTANYASMWLFENCGRYVHGETKVSPIAITARSDIDRRYNATYDLFLKGKLIYRPDPNSDVGKIELRIADLKPNPLEGTFDLSRCGDAGKYFSIATGYRKGKNPANENKTEIWFIPRFFAEKEIDKTVENHHLRTITTVENWNGEVAPVGVLWTWGNWDDLSFCNYLTTQPMEVLGYENLYEKWKHAGSARSQWRVLMIVPTFILWGANGASHDFGARSLKPDWYDKHFQISFVN